MSPSHTSKDRTPAGRAVPALVALAVLAFIGWLLPAIDRHQRPRPGAATAAGPTTISIPGIGVHARVVPVGLQADGAMQVPDPDQVGWYELGPRPGDPGPAVLVGHVYYRPGPAVFYRLRQLHPGDEILIGERGGATRRFLVGRLERHPKTALPVDRIWTTATRPLLRLITCGGSYDHSTGHYRDNLIVYASPTGS
ncbi:MAG TPA: class F sortase [Actinomycetes bacterium]